jgi:hypothetical protein
VDLAGDPGLRAELEAARAWGVPWRRWAGWEPTEVTTFEYDDAGRLIRAETVREAEWGELDRGAAMALAEYEAGLCSGCRHPLVETCLPENEERYVGEVTGRCHRCTALEILREKVADGVERKAMMQPSALLLGVRLRGEDPTP